MLWRLHLSDRTHLGIKSDLAQICCNYTPGLNVCPMLVWANGIVNSYEVLLVWNLSFRLWSITMTGRVVSCLLWWHIISCRFYRFISVMVTCHVMSFTMTYSVVWSFVMSAAMMYRASCRVTSPRMTFTYGVRADSVMSSFILSAVIVYLVTEIKCHGSYVVKGGAKPDTLLLGDYAIRPHGFTYQLIKLLE